MKEADENPDGERDRDRAGDRRGDAEIVRQQQSDHHRDETGDGSDRQVDAAGDDGEGFADGEDRDHRALAEKVGDIVGGPERRRLDRESQPHDQEQAEQREAEEHIQSRAASARLCDRLVGRSRGHFLALALQTPIASVRIVSCDTSLCPWLATIPPRRKTCSVSASS